jgi:hypothetical protein
MAVDSWGDLRLEWLVHFFGAVLRLERRFRASTIRCAMVDFMLAGA